MRVAKVRKVDKNLTPAPYSNNNQGINKRIYADIQTLRSTTLAQTLPHIIKGILTLKMIKFYNRVNE